MGMIGSDEVNRRLGFHPATAVTIPLHEEARARFIDLACWVDETLPPGRETAQSLTDLQDGLMHANASIACNLAPLQDPASPSVRDMAYDRLGQLVTLQVRVPDGHTPEQLAEFVGRQVVEHVHRSAAEQST